jgi:ABC-2 type transport system ATP-binding protein
MDIIELQSVTKSFDKTFAIKDLSFTVKAGSIFGFLGPNGAGKTTTIRVIMDIFAPDRGTVRVFGQPPGEDVRRRIGYLPEERGIYDHMKVHDQLRFFADLHGIARVDADRRIREWLDRFELNGSTGKKVGALSKGTQQKIQFIVSMLHDPDLLMLDEPFTGLDPVSVDVMKTAILELKARNKTIVFSTHQMEQVEQLCDDICLVDHAKILLFGSLRDVKKSYSRRVVRLAFDGVSNFLNDIPTDRVTRVAGCYEILLEHDRESQILLSRAVASGARVTRFELAEASLNDIFIRTVQSANGAKTNGSELKEVQYA